jgi:hypothetical protein
MTTKADGADTKAESESDSDIVDELAQAVGQIHVSEVVDESTTTTTTTTTNTTPDVTTDDSSDEPEEMPEALRKVASWIMDGTVKNILVLTGAGVRYVRLCVGLSRKKRVVGVVCTCVYVAKNGDD